jgi:hypothetical protein
MNSVREQTGTRLREDVVTALGARCIAGTPEADRFSPTRLEPHHGAQI